jgi:hypothetical protein
MKKGTKREERRTEVKGKEGRKKKECGQWYKVLKETSKIGN